MNKESIIATARRLYSSRYEGHIFREAGCVFWAEVTIAACQLHGVEAHYRAGSASWRVMSEADDDGVSPTHFSYMFDPVRAVHSLVGGELPEMHCWAVLEGSGHVLDLTAGWQPNQCRRLAPEIVWPKELQPPTVTWNEPPVTDLHHYTVDWSATKLAIQILENYKARNDNTRSHTLLH